MTLVKGTGVAMVTPLTATGAIDTAALKKVTRHLVDGGVEMLIVLGSTGEAATLNAAEKQTVIETVMAENAGKAHIMLGCGGNDTRLIAAEIGELTRRYAPDSFLSVSPAYNKPSQEGIARHFAAVCGNTDRDVVLYNVPGRTASNVQPATVLRIAAENNNMRGIKEASGNPEQIMELVRSKPAGFMVYSGDDLITLPLVAAGCDGVISVVGNVCPRIFSDMVREALAGQWVSAREKHYALFKLTQLLFAEGNPAGIKAAMELRGLCGAHVNLPLVSASEKLRAELKAELDRLG